MGNSIFKRLFADKNFRILMMGHDSNFHIMCSLKVGKIKCTMPIKGVIVTKLEYKNVEISALALGNIMSIRSLLPHYYSTIHGLVFTVDCRSVCYRVDDTIKEFCMKIEDDKLPVDVPILVLAYNHDIPESLTLDDNDIPETLDDITERLGKENSFKPRRWMVHGVNLSNKKDNGLFEGFEWLTDEMLVNEKDKMALNILAGRDINSTINRSDDKGFLSKFVESLKKTLICRPAVK